MKILLVGASGTLGQAVARHLGQQHQIISAGRNSGSLRVDLTDDGSVAELFAQSGPLDAVISTAGKLHLGPWEHIFYYEFDGRRKKRVLVKIIGE